MTAMSYKVLKAALLMKSDWLLIIGSADPEGLNCNVHSIDAFDINYLDLTLTV